jgi:hypothetical protein
MEHGEREYIAIDIATFSSEFNGTPANRVVTTLKLNEAKFDVWTLCTCNISKNKPMTSPKRLKVRANYYDLLDNDLENWRTKLQKTTSQDSSYDYKLVFYCKPYGGTVLKEFPGYGPTPDMTWSSELWHLLRQNSSPQAVAYSYSAEALAPPPLSAQRLQLFGFTYVICPTSMRLPINFHDLLLRPEKNYLYGWSGLFDPSRAKVSLDLVNRNLDIHDPAHVQEAYDYMNIVNTKVAAERTLLDQLAHLEREYKVKKKFLFDQIKATNQARRTRVISKQKLNLP